MGDSDKAAIMASLSMPSMPTPMRELLRSLHTACENQAGQLSQAITALEQCRHGGPQAAALSLMDSYKMHSLRQQIQRYRQRLPAVDAGGDEGSLRLRKLILHSQGEIVEFDSIDLHHAQVMCDRFQAQVDECLSDVQQSKRFSESQTR